MKYHIVKQQEAKPMRVELMPKEATFDVNKKFTSARNSKRYLAKLYKATKQSYYTDKTTKPEYLLVNAHTGVIEGTYHTKRAAQKARKLKETYDTTGV